MKSLTREYLEDCLDRGMTRAEIRLDADCTKGQLASRMDWLGLKGPIARRMELNKKIFPEGLKQCSQCSEIRPLEEYAKDRRATDELVAFCHKCRKSRAAKNAKKRYHKNLDQSRSKGISDQKKLREKQLKLSLYETDHPYFAPNDIRQGYCRLCDRELKDVRAIYCSTHHGDFMKRMVSYNESLERAREVFRIRKCEICNHEFLPSEYSCLDHSHQNMKFRGVLCSACNIAIGLFRDNPNLIQSAIKYLDKANLFIGHINAPFGYCRLCNKSLASSKGKFYCGSRCRSKASSTNRKFGLTTSELKYIIDNYKLCQICNQFDKKFGIDHCHSTSRIRGILCGKCNAGLGNFKDDIRRMKSAIDYLINRS